MYGRFDSIRTVSIKILFESKFKIRRLRTVSGFFFFFCWSEAIASISRYHSLYYARPFHMLAYCDWLRRNIWSEQLQLKYVESSLFIYNDLFLRWKYENSVSSAEQRRDEENVRWMYKSLFVFVRIILCIKPYSEFETHIRWMMMGRCFFFFFKFLKI